MNDIPQFPKYMPEITSPEEKDAIEYVDRMLKMLGMPLLHPEQWQDVVEAAHKIYQETGLYVSLCEELVWDREGQWLEDEIKNALKRVE